MIINQKSAKERYIDNMLKFMKELSNCVYQGVISYANEDMNNPQPMWIWRKKK